MNLFRKMMWGRYGTDQLFVALCILSFVLSAIAGASNIGLFTVLGSLVLGIAVYRFMSRNVSKRRNENQRFLVKWNPFYYRLRGKYYTLIGRKTHKYFKCPSCGQKLRVPKNKGNISIRCPKCNFSFKGKT